jgi:hypothetical protein
MTGQELVAHLRESILDDMAPPYLWQEAELLRYLNYAEVQACRRAHLIIDGTTLSDNGTAATAGTLGQKPLCMLPIVANVATYNLSPKVLQVKRCQLMSMTYPLPGPKSYSEIDELQSGWWGTVGTLGTVVTIGTSGSSSTSTAYTTAGSAGTVAASGSGGYPYCYINEPGNTITFVLAPSANDIAALVVSRIPLTPFTLQTSPEIEEKYHEGLMDWAAHLAYMKNDSDTINLNLAKVYEDKFTRQFGSLPDAYSDRMRKVLSQKQRMRARAFGE